MKKHLISLLLLAVFFITSYATLAHCDTKEGPVVAAAIKAIEQNNINYVLIWVKPADERELREAFERTMKVRELSADAKALADNYFFETLVRIHRSGEGVPFTGVKPAGTRIDKKILAADKSIEAGSLAPLNDLVPEDQRAELKKRFDQVMALKNYDINNVQAGREYVEAYVHFFHFAEGEGEHHPVHLEDGGHIGHIPWILSGFLFITSVLLGILCFRKK